MENQSNADKFSKRSGTLISTEFINLGIVGDLKLVLIVLRDLITNQEEKAIRFEYDYYNGYDDYPDTKIASLDRDELEGLIKSLEMIVSRVFQTVPANYMEVNFISRSGMNAGCYFSKNNWEFYVKISQHDGNSFVFMNKNYAQSLLNILKQNSNKLIE